MTSLFDKINQPKYTINVRVHHVKSHPKAPNSIFTRWDTETLGFDCNNEKDFLSSIDEIKKNKTNYKNRKYPNDFRYKCYILHIHLRGQSNGRFMTHKIDVAFNNLDQYCDYLKRHGLIPNPINNVEADIIAVNKIK
jgi:hypothetical protein